MAIRVILGLAILLIAWQGVLGVSTQALAAPQEEGGGKGKRAMTVDDLLAVRTVGDPQVSPDGAWVVYSVSEIHRETGKSNSDLWLASTEGKGSPRRLTYSAGADNQARWSPDGETVAFVSDRGGSPQVWLLDVNKAGDARPLTKLPIGVSGPIWSPDGAHIAFVAEVYPGKSPEETAKHDKEREEEKSKVKIYDELMIRHWDSWNEHKRSHLFVVNVQTGVVADLIPDWKASVPPAPFGGSTDYAFSADGKSIAFTSEPLKDHAWSTNTDVWLVPVAGGKAKNLTEANPAADAQPSFSPDGKKLAYVTQDRPGFEADLWKLKVRDLESGKILDVSAFTDRPVQGYEWASDSLSLNALMDAVGHQSLMKFSVNGGDKTLADCFLSKGSISAGQAGPNGSWIAVWTAADHPPELYRISSDGQTQQALTHHNDELVAQLDLSPAEGFHYEGHQGVDVHGWIVRPPGFDQQKKYPVAFLIHGGPQGAWHDDWHARWNMALLAAPGYVVVAINPRGSTGYGQKFTDEISEDWNGAVYHDLMLGLDHVLKNRPYLDGDRVAALGGSFGGYMVNWIAGHSDRFKALISHAGVFDLHSMYFTTEELWFSEWEFGGTPWGSKKHLLDQQSPSRFAAAFKTPTLVIHGALDFRVPDSQGLGMFTALQRQGVPSRYVFFPDEGHWITKSPNRRVWWREVHGWLAKYLK